VNQINRIPFVYPLACAVITRLDNQGGILAGLVNSDSCFFDPKLTEITVLDPETDSNVLNSYVLDIILTSIACSPVNPDFTFSASLLDPTIAPICMGITIFGCRAFIASIASSAVIT